MRNSYYVSLTHEGRKILATVILVHEKKSYWLVREAHYETGEELSDATVRAVQGLLFDEATAQRGMTNAKERPC